MVLYDAIRPLAKHDATTGIHSESNGNDGIEIVETHTAQNLPSPFHSNYRGILGRCRLDKFTFLIDVLQMKSYIVGTAPKEFCHLTLRQPYGISFKPHINP